MESCSDTSQEQPSPTFSADERNAMRAFLQRCEVRLSTMHRVGTAFLSGAGLLLLLPVFLKDGILMVMRSILAYVPVHPVGDTLAARIGTVVAYLGLIYPFLLSIVIPVAAMLLLLKDLIRFYFVGHPPGFSDELFNPRFILTGIAFSPDESADVKRKVMQEQYRSDLMNFVISHADKKSSYYYDIVDRPDFHILPKSRRLAELIRQGVLSVPGDKPVGEIQDQERLTITGDGEPVERIMKDVVGFNAALGLAGFVERPLYEEVAKTEVSLVRHAIKLRRLVLRYFQALLILILTSIVTFLTIPFLQQEQGRYPIMLVMTVAYFVWAALAPSVVKLPLQWLVSSSRPDVQKAGVANFQKSDAVQKFFQLTQRLCYLALAGAVLSVILELALKLV